MAGKKSFGVTVTLGGTTIGGLESVSITGRDVNAVDVTAHDSSGGNREFVGSLIDNGTLELSGNFAGDSAGLTYLEGHLAQTVACVIPYSDASTHTFNCIVGAPSYDNPLDDKIGYSVSCKITGAIAGTATT
jgi:predicted secreted protein